MQSINTHSKDLTRLERSEAMPTLYQYKPWRDMRNTLGTSFLSISPNQTNNGFLIIWTQCFYFWVLDFLILQNYQFPFVEKKHISHFKNLFFLKGSQTRLNSHPKKSMLGPTWVGTCLEWPYLPPNTSHLGLYKNQQHCNHVCTSCETLGTLVCELWEHTNVVLVYRVQHGYMIPLLNNILAGYDLRQYQPYTNTRFKPGKDLPWT